MATSRAEKGRDPREERLRSSLGSLPFSIGRQPATEMEQRSCGIEVAHGGVRKA